MSKYRQFEVYLEGYLDEKLKRAHIISALEDGTRFVSLDIYPNGRFEFKFGGENSYISSFNSLKDFYKFSERLEELEGLGYALVSSCVDAEKSATNGVPSRYRVVVHIAESEDYEYKVVVPQA